MSVLLSSLAILSVAAATPTCSNNPSFHRFSFGGIQGVVVSDGPALFDVNPFSVPNAALKRNYDASFRSSSPLVIQQNVAIVDMPAGRVLVDAGSFNIPEFPQFANAGRLLANMRAAGIAPESIQAVVFTHAHADHVAGVITADGKRAFPNAHVYIDKVDHEFWTQSNVPNPKPAIIPNATLEAVRDIYLRSIKPYRGRLTLVDEDRSPIRGVKLISSPGHSPGHSSVRFQGKGEALLVSGDSWITKPDQLENPEWEFFIELDAAQAYNSRIRVLSAAARRRELMLSYHEAFPGLGYVSVNGAAFSWTPAQAQTELMGTGVATQC